MYNPPKFLTPAVLSEVLAERTWPSSYKLVEDFDGIEIRLPRCRLYVSEGFESEMDLSFLPESTGLDERLPIGDVIRALSADPGRELPPEPPLIDFFSPGASLEKVTNQLRDLITLLFTYVPQALTGDFAWVEVYRQHSASS